MSNRQSILVVDSNEGFATMLKQSLEQDGGYRAAVTTNAQSAMQALGTTPFDLAIVDLGLQKPDGAALARAMRKRQPGLRLMLIPLQGEELPPDLADIDVQGVLPKPFFLPELPDRISEAMSQPMGGAATPALRETPAVSAPSPAAMTTAPQPLPPAAAAPAPAISSEERLSQAREHIPDIVQRMNALAGELNATAVLLTCKGRLISHTGQLAVQDAMGLAQAVAESWRTSLRVGQILGRDLEHFEQSTEGGGYTFYSLAVAEDIVLSTALSMPVPLGMLRHRAKETADALRALLNAR